MFLDEVTRSARQRPQSMSKPYIRKEKSTIVSPMDPLRNIEFISRDPQAKLLSAMGEIYSNIEKSQSRYQRHISEQAKKCVAKTERFNVKVDQFLKDNEMVRQPSERRLWSGLNESSTD